MSNDILSKRALDTLNRASEIKNEIEFRCVSMKMRHTA